MVVLVTVCEQAAVVPGVTVGGVRPRSLLEEQAALRRVATLVASGTPPDELFAAVTAEIGRLLPVEYTYLGRYEPDGVFAVVAAWGRAGEYFRPGRRGKIGGSNLVTIVFETADSARIDSLAEASGELGVAARESGIRSAVGTPILVEGRLWGVVIAGSTQEEPLPAHTEERLASFTELVATAISNAESRAGLARLAEEQAALRRVATLVAGGTPPAVVFGRLQPRSSDCFQSTSRTWAAMSRTGRSPSLLPVGAPRSIFPLAAGGAWAGRT